jgi:hypothetical protein
VAVVLATTHLTVALDCAARAGGTFREATTSVNHGASVFGVVLAGCTAIGDVSNDELCERDASACDASAALCRVTVDGRKLDMEDDYIPHVIACENPAGDLESLKAQAIAIRSYATYVMRTEKRPLRDGTGDQVYSCGRTPTSLHVQAAQETAGQVLRYHGTPVAAFFVAGALQQGPTCRGGTNDPTKTESFVTYNDGKSGTGIVQTSLGSKSTRNNANRGCMSQNGANCLATEGRSAHDILRFYYGADIEIVQTTGPCVGAVVSPDSAWVGDACTADATCDFQVGASTASCLTYTDPDTGTDAGFCSATCSGSCPDLVGHAGTRCVAIEGTGQCVAVPATENENCTAIPGTLPTVMYRYGTTTLATVCAPPQAEWLSCTADGQTGECIDTNVTTCGGTLHTGACPGGTNIRCCTYF